jgi:hypothetical protein
MRKRSLRSLRRYLPFFILLNSVHHNPALPLQSFPELAADFAPPDWVHGDTFSSVLRVSSSDVALWMHYDVFRQLAVSGRDLFLRFETFARVFGCLFLLDLTPLASDSRPQADHDVCPLGPS